MESEVSISCSQQAGCFSTKQERRASFVSDMFSCYRILQLLCSKKSKAKWNLEDTSVRYGVYWNRRCISGNIHLHGAFDCVIQEWELMVLNCLFVSSVEWSDDSEYCYEKKWEINARDLIRVTIHTFAWRGFRHNSRHPSQDSKRASLESKNKVLPIGTTCSAVRVDPWWELNEPRPLCLRYVYSGSHKFSENNVFQGRSQWPCGPRCRSNAAWFFG